MSIMWKTMDNKIMEISDMTDVHIENAIKYLYRKGDPSNSIHILQDEKIRRIKERSRRICPFCKNNSMELTEYEEYPDPDSGPGPGYMTYSYYMECNLCGGRGPTKEGKIDWESLKEVEKWDLKSG